MSDANKPVFKRKRPITVTQVRESAEKIADSIAPLPDLEGKRKIALGRGKKPTVVEAFLGNPKNMKLKAHIAEGLSPLEAGIMAGYSKEELQTLQLKSEPYRRFVEIALIEFKRHHLKVIKDKADPKTSQWLLEKSFPEEFAAKAKGSVEEGGHGSTTVIHAIFKSVQTTPDNVVPVAYEYTDTTTKEEQDDSSSQDARGAGPSLNAGGANII
jgi:hypothetical protein